VSKIRSKSTPVIMLISDRRTLLADEHDEVDSMQVNPVRSASTQGNTLTSNRRTPKHVNMRSTRAQANEMRANTRTLQAGEHEEDDRVRRCTR